MNIFDKILVSLPEYNFFRELPDLEQVQYLLEVYDIETKRDNPNLVNGLNDFFEDIHEQHVESGIEFDSFDYTENDRTNRVDVMIDNENIVIESNSLKALRFITYKFFDTGYVLFRDIETEKLFKADKVTRYLRVFRILGKSGCLCPN